VPGERWDAGGIEKAVGVVDGARCHTIAALGEECRDLLVLLFCLAGVVHGKRKNSGFLPACFISGTKPVSPLMVSSSSSVSESRLASWCESV